VPKKTYTLRGFDGGMNNNADSHDLIKNNQLEFACNCNFDSKGKIKWQSDSLGTDQATLPTGGFNVTVDEDMDVKLGGFSQDSGYQLRMTATDDVTSTSSDLSWMDGTYNFKYSVCRDLDNGIIEEGPLQSFSNGGTGVDMSGDGRAKFYFFHSGTTNPPFMDADYEGKICGRVYYSQITGSAATSQPGWIHLCDLILDDFDLAHSIFPRAIDTTVAPTTNSIDIEEPPIAASYEMNAGYSSEAGIKARFTGDTVTVGMVKYSIPTVSPARLYKSLPGQPHIWPADNWVEIADERIRDILELGDFICMWSGNNESKTFYVYDVRNDMVVQTHKGLGLQLTGGHIQKPAKCGNAVTWGVGALSDTSQVYYFDGQLREIGKARVKGLVSDSIQFYPENGFIYYQNTDDSLNDHDYNHLYSLTTDTWSFLELSDDSILFPYIDFGEPSRYKRIYSFSIHGSIGAVHALSSILTGLDDENANDISGKFTASGFEQAGDAFGIYQEEHGTLTFKANESVKIRSMRMHLNWKSNTAGFKGDINSNYNYASISSISYVYKILNKFSQ